MLSLVCYHQENTFKFFGLLIIFRKEYWTYQISFYGYYILDGKYCYCLVSLPGVDFINCFAPYLRLAPNVWETFYWRKSSAQGTKQLWNRPLDTKGVFHLCFSVLSRCCFGFSWCCWCLSHSVFNFSLK